MQSEKALAIVVRGTDWSETSRITTLFTREFGKVRALAKGGRRLKSNFDVAFDLLTVCEVVFIRKASGLELLTEARMNQQFPALRRNLPALYAGYYVAELLADGLQDYDPHPALFEAALRTLGALGDGNPPPNPLPEGKRRLPLPSPLAGEGGESSSRVRGDLLASEQLRGPAEAGAPSPGGEAPPPSPARGEGQNTSSASRGPGASPSLPATVSAFELVWLHELGYSPRLDACATCGRERLNPTARAFFSPLAGGVLCPECGPAVADRRMVSGDALGALRALGAEGTPDLPDEARAEVRQVLGYAVSCVLGRRPRLLSYVDGR